MHYKIGTSVEKLNGIQKMNNITPEHQADLAKIKELEIKLEIQTVLKGYVSTNGHTFVDVDMMAKRIKELEENLEYDHKEYKRLRNEEAAKIIALHDIIDEMQKAFTGIKNCLIDGYDSTALEICEKTDLQVDKKIKGVGMSKPREFWINERMERIYYKETYHSCSGDEIHVIEYSAHQAALDKIKELEADNRRLKNIEILYECLKVTSYTENEYRELQFKIKELEIVNNRALSSEPYQKITALYSIIDEMKQLIEIAQHKIFTLQPRYDEYNSTEFKKKKLALFAAVDLKLKELK